MLRVRLCRTASFRASASVVRVGSVAGRFGHDSVCPHIWAYQKTGLATVLALVDFFHGATIVVTPLAGAYSERANPSNLLSSADELPVECLPGDVPCSTPASWTGAHGRCSRTLPPSSPQGSSQYGLRAYLPDSVVFSRLYRLF